MAEWQEAEIVINGRRLNHAESMTIRVAIEHFASDLREEGLGDDEMGKAITAGYLKSIKGVREKIHVR